MSYREAGFLYAALDEYDRARDIWTTGLELARSKIDVFPENVSDGELAAGV